MLDIAHYARMDAEEAEYVAEGLADWREDNPVVDPETNDDWAEEKAELIGEFAATKRAFALKERTKALKARTRGFDVAIRPTAHEVTSDMVASDFNEGADGESAVVIGDDNNDRVVDLVGALDPIAELDDEETTLDVIAVHGMHKFTGAAVRV